MRSYIIKFSAGIAYEQNLPTGVASALIAQFVFLAKSALKMHCTKINFQTKVVTNHNTQHLVLKLFLSPHGCGLCPDGTIRFFGKKVLKLCCTKVFSQTKVVTNQNLQLLCYVTFFDILHRYGVIAASQICSVSRKYCAVLRNRLLLLLAIPIGDAIWDCRRSFFFFFFFLFFRHDFVRAISLEPLLTETPN